MKPTPNQRKYLHTSALWAVFDSLTSTYLIAFSLLLGASNIMVGILGAIPFIATFISELLGAKLTEYWGRVPIIVCTYAIDKFMWLLIALVPFLSFQQPLIMVVLFYFTAYFFVTIREPSVVSLVADIVPQEARGRYLGRVNKATGIVAMITMLAAGFFISWVGDTSQTAYAILFVLAAIFGYITMWSFSTMTEPRRTTNHHYTLKDVFNFNQPFGGFCARAMFFRFSAYLASPFASAYMLRDLHLETRFFGLATATYVLSQIVFYRPMGKLADRFGDRVLIVIGVMGTALTMFLWFNIRADTLWLIWPTQILSGAAWAATELAFYNVVLDVTDKKTRPLQIAQYSMLVASAQAVGPIVGGILADSAGFWLITGIPFVFLLSSGMRLISGLLFLGMHEPRLKHQYSFRDIVRVARLQHMQHRVQVLPYKQGQKYK